MGQLRTQAGRAKLAAGQLLERAARRSGYELVERHFYSPLPEVERLPESLWEGPQPTPGLDLRIEQALRLLQDELQPWIAEFDPPPTARDGVGFHVFNGAYESVDAEVLYALLRHLRPRQVIELGSGASSHVIDLARRRNAADDAPFTHEIFDPFPFGHALGPVADAVTRPVRAEEVPVAEIERLKDGDVLFVDTTHTVKTGGDVVRIVLELLPAVPVGVHVHVHDIFLPYEYPREWVLDQRRAWAEQYMLQAFLAFNPTYEVVFPAQAVARAHPAEVGAAIPSFTPAVSPGAFWMRRL